MRSLFTVATSDVTAPSTSRDIAGTGDPLPRAIRSPIGLLPALSNRRRVAGHGRIAPETTVRGGHWPEDSCRVLQTSNRWRSVGA